MKSRWFAFFVGISLAISVRASAAGFDVASWNLRTTTSDSAGFPTIHDNDVILTISNPLSHIGNTQVGPNSTHVEYNHSWHPNLPVGTFNTFTTHAVRSIRIRETSTADIVILPAKDIHVTIDASVAYNHTPGDETGILFGANVVDLTNNILLAGQTLFLGNLNSQPSSATRTIQDEATLLAGHPYRLRYTLVTDNGGDVGFPPTGIADATAWVNFAITPEPSTAMLLALVAPLLIRRRLT